MFQINIRSSGPPQREENFFRERKILGGLLNFISFQYATMNEWMNEWEDTISLVVLSCGLRETSRVDYTERRKTERKKFFYVFPITSPAAHHREKKFFFREIKNF